MKKLFLILIFLGTAFAFQANAQFMSVEGHDVPISGYGGGGSNPKAGVLIHPLSNLDIIYLKFDIGSTNDANMAYIYSATSGGYALGTLLATGSIDTFGFATMSFYATTSYYWILADRDSGNWEVPIFDPGTGAPIPQVTKDHVQFLEAWNAGFLATRPAWYALESIYFFEQSSETRIVSQSASQLNDIIDLNYTIFLNSADSYDYVTAQVVGYDDFGFSELIDNVITDVNFTSYTDTLEIDANKTYMWRLMIWDSTGQEETIFGEWTRIGNWTSTVENAVAVWTAESTDTLCNGSYSTATSSIWSITSWMNAGEYFLCRMVSQAFVPSSSSTQALTNKLLNFQYTFPFSLFLEPLNRLNQKASTSPAQLTANIVFPWATSTNTGIGISSTTLSAVVGADNLALFKQIIGYMIWLGTMFAVWKLL